MSAYSDSFHRLLVYTDNTTKQYLYHYVMHVLDLFIYVLFDYVRVDTLQYCRIVFLSCFGVGRSCESSEPLIVILYVPNKTNKFNNCGVINSIPAPANGSIHFQFLNRINCTYAQQVWSTTTMDHHSFTIKYRSNSSEFVVHTAMTMT